MKTIKVAAAIIKKEEKILIAKRIYGAQAGLWEFPGGKYEEGEKGEETIVREIREEFDADIVVERKLCTIKHDYEDFRLVMDCFVCHFISDEISLHDHSDIRFIDINEEDIDWVPADRKVIEAIRKEEEL